MNAFRAYTDAAQLAAIANTALSTRAILNRHDLTFRHVRLDGRDLSINIFGVDDARFIGIHTEC